ncbi:hypothetical protein OESDEN_00898 [Oesophagostomum dentatum]|uniref:Uncharacterized protein n=1 Tax=Oesophagostomum dentatum TaxID=61180 RepID=A0A0B1TUJ7_OESDE|nr:hypothetical protein OESDEN_00898 [Oesophagostomum dentatum]
MDEARELSKESREEEATISRIIENAYSRRIKARNTEEHSELTGNRLTLPVRLLGDEAEAVIDVGSMVSIISIWHFVRQRSEELMLMP